MEFIVAVLIGIFQGIGIGCGLSLAFSLQFIFIKKQLEERLNSCKDRPMSSNLLNIVRFFLNRK